ncbi:MAG: MAPEG family protein [Alphaproteobacteria bacterium]|nr:MAPEG family protein [Alphaproteobacteria bacterium]
MSGVPILPPLVALVLFAVWAMVLVLAIGAWRVGQTIGGGKKAGDFPAGVPHGSDTYWRLNRAHLNTLENLPVFGTLILTGTMMQLQDTAFQLLPTLVLYARLTQSVIHIASGSVMAVTLRFLAYAVQVGSMLVIASVVLKAAGLPLPW